MDQWYFNCESENDKIRTTNGDKTILDFAIETGGLRNWNTILYAADPGFELVTGIQTDSEGKVIEGTEYPAIVLKRV